MKYTFKSFSGLSMTLLTAMFALNGCSSDEPQFENCQQAGDACVRFTLLHTNDHHGRFWQSDKGEYGMAARKTLIDEIRQQVKAEGGQVLLLSGGDINTGVPESDLQSAEPDFMGMNLLEYDAMAVGNHEFDNPLATLDKQREWANFPMLSANIYREVEGQWQPYFEPYKIFDVGPLKLAIVGLTTEQTAQIGNPKYVKSLRFTSPQIAMKNTLTMLKHNEKPDLVFALTHMGHYPDGQHGSNTPGDVLLARSLRKGQLDGIIGGHSQNPVCMGEQNTYVKDFQPGDECRPDQQQGTWIMQAHEWGKYVGRADFEYLNGQLHLANYQLIPVNLHSEHHAIETITQNEQMLELLEPYQQKGQAVLNEVISDASAKWQGGRSVVRHQINEMGVMIAKAQSQGVAADFGIINSGGIRASIEKGPIRYRDVLTVQPFANLVTMTKMRGDALTNYLATVATQSRGSGGFAHFSDIDMVVDCQAQKVSINSINGQAFNPNQQYRFSLPGYNAAGGNGYPILADALDTGLVDADVLLEYIKQHQPLDPNNPIYQHQVKFIGASTALGCDG
ncbi:bifunctional UDP-sugar hydrolase/5'-nucleotidase UshA [Shewanella intestini]|uniref:Bifunctional UDP-sugar hydrolase/5'-nucleotidase n=1 Tax=Shewanella intestini TaxID=2017544 RepID=A0ABS5I011_9GAMM|nr:MULTISPECIES: bifunctional UDP-sugar hydrolase/5'-nucleotidase UshA [Shewanella]MBR9727374.1 bifunctional UDP-sugar hydrolase/5'-nucleotidase [Shewanella intestini]MRG35576.1 bifunctional UDP-sugar hydrolase/5'-nucleotidase [Shewanella sp. XMDDZSB0408]